MQQSMKKPGSGKGTSDAVTAVDLAKPNIAAAAAKREKEARQKREAEKQQRTVEKYRPPASCCGCCG